MQAEQPAAALDEFEQDTATFRRHAIAEFTAETGIFGISEHAPAQRHEGDDIERFRGQPLDTPVDIVGLLGIHAARRKQIDQCPGAAREIVAYPAAQNQGSHRLFFRLRRRFAGQVILQAERHAAVDQNMLAVDISGFVR